ncbi:MAG: amino acid synthesis family protein [Alphaproteobacteria bacterium]|nr:amino acid synthesis family protein [Alphaproteobacteria bacterium]
MTVQIRKTVTYVEDIGTEGGRPVSPSHVIAIVAAIVKNPWAGQGFVANLKPEIVRHGPELGKLMVPRLLAALGGPNELEAYGKAAIVGLNGEIEHASALIHTLYFGNELREAVSGTAFLSFTNKRAAAGCSIDVPLKHKTKEGARSHFLTASFSIADAPHPDEIVVALAGANSGRPHARIGDRYEDMKEMGVDQTKTVKPARAGA